MKPISERKPLPAKTTTQPTIANLHLSLEQPVYSSNESIPVELRIQVGKFDLLVPHATVEGKGAFAKLVVKNVMGKVVKPTHPITFARQIKMLIRKGKQVRCVQGVNLKAGALKTTVLEDLQTYYKLLAMGDYTLQVLMDIEVYRESLPDQSLSPDDSLQILNLEREIAMIQRSPKLPAAEKQQAANHLRKEIELIQSGTETTLDQIYLPSDSLRGAKKLESNIVALTIQ